MRSSNSPSSENAIIDLERKTAELIVTALDVGHPADATDEEVPLYGDELGLDSIDVLETAVVVSKE